MKMIRIILDRLDEKTTWFAFGAMLSALGVAIEPGLWEAISVAGIGVATLIMALLPTKTAEQKVADAVNRRLPEQLRRDDPTVWVPSLPDADPARRARYIDNIYGAFEVD